ncbi:MAG: hypothetical protein RLZZ406_71, partial [Pseudomonadota bacterium]
AIVVLNAVADGIGWTKPAAPGVFRGVAQMRSFGSYVAAACELSVKNGNEVKIHRFVAATDPGYVVNPAQVARQVSGSFVYGLSALFEEEITIEKGAQFAYLKCLLLKLSSFKAAVKIGVAWASQRLRLQHQRYSMRFIVQPVSACVQCH